MKNEKAKHTPGPWILSYGPNNSCDITAPADDGLQTRKRLMDANAISEDVGSIRPNKNWEADAKLMAAAPELLNACEMAVNELNEGCDIESVISWIKLAIKNAKGE